MTLIDTHAHIYLDEFDEDRKIMLERAEKEGVEKIFMPAIDSTTHEKLLETEKQFPEKCKSMMGLHPCSIIKENYKTELQIVHKYLDQKKFIAIGEIGLDFYWDLTYRDQQYEAFQQQIDWALEYNEPIIIHSRNSLEECINIIEKRQNGNLRGAFHCFSGNIEQAQKISNLGFYMGIGGVLTFKNSGLDKIIIETSLDHIILETDSPYLTPVPFRGKRNECSYLKYIVQRLAEVKQKDIEEVATTTTANAQKLFGL